MWPLPAVKVPIYNQQAMCPLRATPSSVGWRISTSFQKNWQWLGKQNLSAPRICFLTFLRNANTLIVKMLLQQSTILLVPLSQLGWRGPTTLMCGQNCSLRQRKKLSATFCISWKFCWLFHKQCPPWADVLNDELRAHRLEKLFRREEGWELT